MKKILLLLFVIPYVSFSQMIPENEIAELRRLEQTEVSQVQEGGTKGDALKQQIRNKYSILEQEAIRNFTQRENIRKKNEETVDAQNRQKNEYNRVQTNNYNQEVLLQLKQNQVQSQNNYNQEVSNTLNSLSNSMQAMAYQSVKKELDRRRTVANNFVGFHSEKITKLTNLYNQVPKSSFTKNLNGVYSAHLFNSKKYSFVNNQELVTETGCLVRVENNVVKDIYLYGKEKMNLDYPTANPENSLISNGIVKYSNYETLETVTLLILEPYMSKTPKQYSIIKDGVGFLTIWTDNKKEEGKILYIQELDNNGNIIREVSTPLVYAKSESLIDPDKIIKLPMNSGNNFLFFGEVTQTPYGRIPLYPKMSKKDMKALEDGEDRIVEIKKYRE